MGMPITIEIAEQANKKIFLEIFNYFRQVDKQFSPYKKNSEVSLINQVKLTPKNYSKEMKQILYLAKKTKRETNGYFDIYNKEVFDPSGIVKGWAIKNAANILLKLGIKNFSIEAGGDIQVNGKNSAGQPWKVGIRNPFNSREIVKVVQVSTNGVATSGNYERGNHIYNPKGDLSDDVVSVTVIGKNIFEADRFATAAFAMGSKGIEFIDTINGLEGYAINSQGIARLTSGFNTFVKNI
jgi:thiamine biosynthesis lipoprotein